MSVGIYADLPGAKLRLFGSTAANPNDSLLQSYCDEVNSTIEQFTGRVLAPIPAFSTTVTATAGSSTATLGTVGGLAVGDDLLLGPLSGNHEAWSVVAIDNVAQAADAWTALTGYAVDDLVQPVTPNGHTYRCVHTGTTGASQPTWPTDGSAVSDGTVIWLDEGSLSATVTLDGPLANSYSGAACQRIYVQDGFGALAGEDGLYGRVLVVDRGIITLAQLEVATYTDGPFAVIPIEDWFLRPSGPDLVPGWPFTELWMTNIPHAGNTSPVFYPGYANIRLIGPGPCVGMSDKPAFGWPSVPDEIRTIAYNMLAGRWQQRQSGGTYEVQPGTDSVAVGSFLLSRFDYTRLIGYRVKAISVV